MSSGVEPCRKDPERGGKEVRELNYLLRVSIFDADTVNELFGDETERITVAAVVSD